MAEPVERRARHVGPGRAEDWGHELQRLVARVDDEALDAARGAVAGAAVGEGDGARRLSRAEAAIVAHCQAGDPSERERRFQQADSALFYRAHTLEVKAVEREALASLREEDELAAQVEVIEIDDDSDDDDDDDEVVAVEPTPSEAEALRVAAQDRAQERARKRQLEDDERAARALLEADQDASRAQLEADEQLARDLAAGADPRVEADARVARALAEELNGRSAEASAPRPGDGLNGRPAEALVPRPAVAGPAPPPLGAVRDLRVILPGGAKVDLRGLPADQPLSLITRKIARQLGLAAHQDPMADFVLASGLDRYTREDMRSLTIGEICGNDRRLRVRVERRADFGVVIQGTGRFAGSATVMRLSAPNGVISPIVVIRDPFGDRGEHLTRLVEKYSLPAAFPAIAVRDPGTYKATRRHAPKEVRAFANAVAESFRGGGGGGGGARLVTPTPPARRRSDPAHLVKAADSVRGLNRGSLGQLSIPIAARPSARRGLGFDGGRFINGSVPSGLAAAADECLDLAERAVADPSLLPRSRENAGEASRRLAVRALANRRPWKMTAGIMYPPNGSLHNHIDSMGWWVCLFNLGNDATFHAGTGENAQFMADRGNPIYDFTFRSGDCLVFNGAPEHKALHGMATVHANTNPADAPDWLRNTRTSVQVRQV